MNFRRFFVTFAAILSTLAAVACSKGEHKATELKAERKKKNEALRAEGNALLAQSDVLRKELDQAPFKISISDAPIANPVASGKALDHKTVGLKYNWERLTVTERQAAKEKLAATMTALTQALEIDAKKGVWIRPIEKVKDRKAAVESYQESLGNFELQYGEQFNPPTAGSGPLYKSL